MSESTERRYATTLTWTPGSGGSTTSYTSYSRSHTVAVDGKQTIAVSADASFRGDGSLWNPEDMLVASLSSCHMLWYLHLCAAGGIEIEPYTDRATGVMIDDGSNSRFEDVCLFSEVVIASGDPAQARRLHDEAHSRCFIANSVSFQVRHVPTIIEVGRSARLDPLS